MIRAQSDLYCHDCRRTISWVLHFFHWASVVLPLRRALLPLSFISFFVFLFIFLWTHSFPDLGSGRIFELAPVASDTLPLSRFENSLTFWSLAQSWNRPCHQRALLRGPRWKCVHCYWSIITSRFSVARAGIRFHMCLYISIYVNKTIQQL